MIFSLARYGRVNIRLGFSGPILARIRVPDYFSSIMSWYFIFPVLFCLSDNILNADVSGCCHWLPPRAASSSAAHITVICIAVCTWLQHVYHFSVYFSALPVLNGPRKNYHCRRFHLVRTSMSAVLLRSAYSTPWIQLTISRKWCMYANNYIKVLSS